MLHEKGNSNHSNHSSETKMRSTEVCAGVVHGPVHSFLVTFAVEHRSF